MDKLHEEANQENMDRMHDEANQENMDRMHDEANAENARIDEERKSPAEKIKDINEKIDALKQQLQELRALDRQAGNDAHMEERLQLVRQIDQLRKDKLEAQVDRLKGFGTAILEFLASLPAEYQAWKEEQAARERKRLEDERIAHEKAEAERQRRREEAAERRRAAIEGWKQKGQEFFARFREKFASKVEGAIDAGKEKIYQFRLDRLGAQVEKANFQLEKINEAKADRNKRFDESASNQRRLEAVRVALGGLSEGNPVRERLLKQTEAGIKAEQETQKTLKQELQNLQNTEDKWVNNRNELNQRMDELKGNAQTQASELDQATANLDAQTQGTEATPAGSATQTENQDTAQQDQAEVSNAQQVAETPVENAGSNDPTVEAGAGTDSSGIAPEQTPETGGGTDGGVGGAEGANPEAQPEVQAAA
jgi:hypothetical protein